MTARVCSCTLPQCRICSPASLADVPQEPFVWDLPEINARLRGDHRRCEHNLPLSGECSACDAAEALRFRAACDGDDPAVAIIGAHTQPAKLACLTEAQQQKAWAEWHDSKVYQDLLRDMAAGEVEFGVALATAFIAGITAK